MVIPMRPRSGPDAASRLLAAAVRALPADRADWGEAMLAELASVEPRSARRAFAWGCLRATATQPRLLRGGLHLIAVLGVVVAVGVWAATLGYAPLTGVLDILVLSLAWVCWQGRRARMLGPVDDGIVAWLLRVGGYVLAGTIVVACATQLNPATDDRLGPRLFVVVLACYLLGLATVSARRSTATTWLRATAAGCGLAAAALWVVAVMVAPPISPSIGGALALTAIAAISAAALNSGRAGSPQRAAVAAALAGAVTAALIAVLVLVLASYGPARLIPNITPHALTPADRLAQSRVEIFEPYMVVVVFGCFLAAALGAISVATRRTRPPQAAHLPNTELPGRA
jgi:hypothetical protein